MPWVDKDKCAGCDVCVEKCPVEAIFAEEDTPEEWENYIKINADFFKD